MENTAKYSALVILFLISCLFGFVLPYCVIRILQRRFTNSVNILNNIISILHCFSGGVFFSTSILALLPEAREQVEKAGIALKGNEEYPASELILGIGFLFILVLENVTIYCHRRHTHVNDQYIIAKKETTKNDTGAQMTIATISANSVARNDSNGASNGVPEIRTGNHEHMEDEPFGKNISFIRNMTMLMALSIHMVFDGLELGLLDTDSQVWSLLLALSIHKVLILFSMGLNMCESTTVAKFAIAMVYLSLISPIGVGIGIVLSSEEENVAVMRASAFLQSFAVGNFIYVAFFEILLKEFISVDGNRILKTSATVIGFALFAMISYFLPG